MARLVRATWRGTELFRTARTSRAMTNERRCHDVYIATLAPMGLDPVICRGTHCASRAGRVRPSHEEKVISLNLWSLA
jgi:hypothetical protein